MKNWLGQNIEVGSVVGRGARDGNTSSFKLGVVTKVNPTKNTVTVNWKYEPGYIWNRVDTGEVYIDGFYKGNTIYDQEDWGVFPRVIDSVGHPHIGTVFLQSEDDLARCDKVNALYQEKLDRDNGVPMTQQEWDERLEQI